MNRTKIICTSGPAIDSEKKITELAKKGMAVIRFNCSHGDFKNRLRVLRLVRRVEKKLKQPIGVMLDLQGPKLRIGDLPKPFLLQEDEVWCLSNRLPADEEKKIIPLKLAHLADSVEKGDAILIHDGLIHTKVTRKNQSEIYVKVQYGGLLESRKGVNIPHYKGPLQALSLKDKKDLVWGIENEVDFVALSFVRSVDDIRKLKKEITKLKPKNPPLVIAKIEKPGAVKDMEDIVIESDGILVARGDLGVELKPEEVPVVQKQLIEVCRFHRTPVIVATQMLDSMRFHPIPTRAEVSDVASAIYAGTDALLLTAETSTGKYPVQATAMMSQIVKEVEAHMIQKDFRKEPKDFGVQSYKRALAFNVVQMASDVKAKAIVVLNRRGDMTKRISKIHPKQPVFSLAVNATTYRQLSLYWGIFPINMKQKNTAARIKKGTEILLYKKAIKKGDRLVFLYRDYKSEAMNLKVVEV